MKIKTLLLLFLSHHTFFTYAKITSVVNQAISSTAFDKRTGIVYGGCTAPNGAQSLFKIGPVTGENAQPITDIANTFNNHAVGLLKLGYTTDNTPHLAATISAAGENEIILTNILTKDLKTGTERIRALGNQFGVPSNIKNFTIFSAGSHNFIVYAIANNNLVFPGQHLDAQPPETGLYIEEFNNTLLPTGNHFTTTLTVKSDCVTGLTQPIIGDTNPVSMKWDAHLQRLFVGISGTTVANNAGANCIITLSCFQFNNAFDTLEAIQLNAHSARYGFGDTPETSSIIGGVKFNSALNFSINNLDTMLTTTGKNYAIINGGRGTPGATKMKVFAIPLVGPQGDIPGALATVLDRTKATINFNLRVSESENLFKETDTAAIVGGGPLPCPDGNITKMEVIGDTVYCGLAGIDDADNTPALYFSHAIFNNSGSISGWTDWTLALPLDISGNAVNNGSCFSFGIDAARGKIWTINNAARTLINLTEWKYQTDLTTFGGQINSKLEGPCYSHLSLDQYVENIGNEITSRFALFGGYNKVVAIRTGVAGAVGYYQVNKPTSQWNNPTNSAVTLPHFPEDVGPVLCLLYTQRAAGDLDHKNFFFAGTNLGLYIFDANSQGDGFDIGDANILSTMNHANNVFSKGKWHKVAGIESPVTKLVNYTDPITEKPYVMALVKDGTYGHTIVATQVGTTALNSTVTTFDFHKPEILTIFGIDTIYDIHTIKLSDGTSSFLAATNKGIINSIYNINFLSHHIITRFLYPQTSRSNETFYTLELIDDLRTGNNLPKMIIKQMTMSSINASENHTDSIYNNPAHGITSNTTLLNLADAEDNQERIMNLHQINPITYFYNTGSIRWLLMRTSEEEGGYNKLITLPYRIETTENNITKINNSPDVSLANHESYNWIANVGAGYTMIGTNKGVLTLE